VAPQVETTTAVQQTTTALPVTTTTVAVTTTTALPPMRPSTAAATSPQPVGRDAQSMVDAAIARLPAGLWDYLHARGWNVGAQGGARGYQALTWRAKRLTVVYVRSSMDFDDVLGALTHEVGHMVDFTCFTDDDRDAILEARGRAGGIWFPATNDADDRHYGDGDWAEIFSMSITGRWDGLFASPGVATAQSLAAEHTCR
jgi:hypothetical protein